MITWNNEQTNNSQSNTSNGVAMGNSVVSSACWAKYQRQRALEILQIIATILIIIVSWKALNKK